MNKKIILPVAILSLLSLAVFVSAFQYPDNTDKTIQIHKGWNLVPVGFVFGNPFYDSDITTCTTNDLKYGYAYINMDKFETDPSYHAGDEGDKYFLYALTEYMMGYNGQQVKSLAANLNPEYNNLKTIADALGITEQELLIIDQEYGIIFRDVGSIWVYSEANCQLGYKFKAGASQSMADIFSKEWFSERTPVSVPGKEVQPYLNKGWNFLTITPGLQKLGSIANIAGECAIQKAYSYDGENQKWESIGLSMNLPEDYVFKGIILKVPNKCNIAYTEY